jgi:Xaa-Pro aminopeptidase
MFSAEFFTGNRQRLAKACECDFVVLAANGTLQKSADTVFALRQDSNFWYVSGLQVADAVVVIDCKMAESFVILPPRLAMRDQWEGKLDTVALAKLCGITDFTDSRTGWARLASLTAKGKTVGTILPASSYIGVYGMHINPAKIRFRRKLKKLVSPTNLLDIRLPIAHLRQVKQPAELTSITEAVSATTKSLTLLKDQIASFSSERDVDIFLSHQFRLHGGTGHAYDPIVATGKNAATIHYQDNNATFQKNGLLLMDVGAEVNGYAADISRTYALSPPTPRQQAVFDAVQSVHNYALTLLKPGVILREYERLVEEHMGKELITLGLINSMDRKKIRFYFPHLTSHYLGFDVHDAGDYDQPLSPNTVITVEPGIYLPKEGIGVRIEDDILITDTGATNLSEHLPIDLLYYL